jgi:hypothetical protein
MASSLVKRHIGARINKGSRQQNTGPTRMVPVSTQQHPRERISFVLSDVQRRDERQHHDAETPPHPPHPPHPPPSHAHQDAVEVAAALECGAAPRQRIASNSHHAQQYIYDDRVHLESVVAHPHPHPNRAEYGHAPHLHSRAPLEVPLPPPPALPSRRGPSCVCSLACIAAIGCTLFLACVSMELTYVNLDLGGGAATALQRRREYAKHMRIQQNKLGTAAPPVHVGLWDEHGAMTPLQLNVALSLALGVDEQSVKVTNKGAHFFDVTILGEGEWLLDTLNSGPEGSFFKVLNAQAMVFGAKLVMSNEATLVSTVNETAAKEGSRF